MVPGKVAKLLVRNRPLEHYALSVYSLLFRGYCIDNNNDIITLIAPSRSIGRTTDLANLLARVCAPGLLWLSSKRTKISNRGQKTKNGNGYPKVSNLIVNLTSFNRPNPSNKDIEEGKDFSQEVEKKHALDNFNTHEFGSDKDKYLTKKEYAIIEALMVYSEKPSATPRETNDLREEYEDFLKREIYAEFLHRIKEAIPSQNELYETEIGEDDVAQKFNICELEFLLSTILKEGYTLNITCSDNMKAKLEWTSEEKKAFIEKKMKPPHQEFNPQMVNIGKIHVSTDGDDNKNIKYELLSKDSDLPITVENCPCVKSRIESALMRMGLLTLPKLEALAKDMCRFSDIIIGIDTNCFYHGIITASILDSFVGVARYPYLDTPNWITLVTSVITTGEIEHKANTSNLKKGTYDKSVDPSHNRRSACRALQEFMEIGDCADLEGVAMSLTGEIPPDINFSSGENTVRDELIRKQIKKFFTSIGFNKGTYFLTEDKMCAMFARAEGLNAVYLEREEMKHLVSLTNLFPQKDGEEKDIHNVSELVYELGIEFPLKITCSLDGCHVPGYDFSGLSFIVDTDWRGKTLQEWENRSFVIKINNGNEKIYKQFFNCIEKNAKLVKLGQLLWGWQQVNTKHHEGQTG